MDFHNILKGQYIMTFKNVIWVSHGIMVDKNGFPQYSEGQYIMTFRDVVWVSHGIMVDKNGFPQYSEGSVHHDF